MAFIKVDWERLKGSEYPFIEQIDRFVDASFPDIEGDELLMFKNTYNDQYCVYWATYNEGERIGLAQHIDLVGDLWLYEERAGHDDVIAGEMRDLIEKKASDAEFPMNWPDIPHGMTWRELVDEILKHPNMLDETARVWTPKDMPPEYDFSDVSGVTSYDYDETPANSENFLSIDLLNW